MSKVAIKGADTGTGVFTLESPATNTDRTLTIPDQTGKVMATGGGAINVSTSAADDSVVVDASGNAGLGVTPSGWYSLSKAIDIGSGGAIESRTNTPTTFSLATNAYLNSSGDWAYKGTGVANLFGLSDGTFKFYNAPSGTAGNAISFTQAMTLDQSGNLLVGTTSNTIAGAGAGQTAILSTTAGRFALSLGNSASSSAYGLGINSQTGENAYFYYQGAYKGGISTSSGGTSYNTSSDYRLKEDWVAVADASTRVNALKPVNFAWKADGKRVDGFLAHEVAEVVPEAVTGTKDAMRDEEYEVTPAVLDDDGNVVTPAVMGTRSVPDYQGIDQSKLVPLLTAALQEALARIETLEADVATLKGNV